MDPKVREAALKKLKQIAADAEADNVRYERFCRPLTHLLGGSFSSKSLDDGSEVFTGGGVTITVPPSCVVWDQGIVPDKSPPKSMLAPLKDLLSELNKPTGDMILTKHEVLLAQHFARD
jgi:hypothetical protein